uniref:Conjugal transfer protein n=1 Tax=Panagrellus redivivus TaxID=6233 RepID=A0A7E4V5C0_PANRE
MKKPRLQYSYNVKNKVYCAFLCPLTEANNIIFNTVARNAEIQEEFDFFLGCQADSGMMLVQQMDRTAYGSDDYIFDDGPVFEKCL